jgi:L-amino acid N-acyltransferase YncA
MSVTIRLAMADDAEQIAAIYAPIVRDTAISFEVEPPTASAMQQRIMATLVHWPWLVANRDGRIFGYAYASRHRVRAAYAWSVDASVYVHEECRRAGVGRGLYRSLFSIVGLQGFYNAYAGITLPNASSVGLHETMGFEPVGVYRHVGYKLGVWHDVGWWQLSLREPAPSAGPPVDLKLVQASTEWDAALSAGLPLIRA